MVRLMDGRLDAFEELYSRHASRVRTFVLRMTGDPDAADDITQDVFLKVYRNPKAFDPRGKFLTWIYAVTRNACIDYLRVRRRPMLSLGARGDDEPHVPDPPSPTHEGPEPTTLQAELQAHIDETAATLSRKLREVFVLCAVQGLSYEDAAAVLGCPVKTVSSRLCRAREKFLKKFRSFLDGVGSPAPS